MENSMRSARYVIEDSIPKATSDGEPHELMTIVAMISGLIAAVIVLIVLFSLIVNRRHPNDMRDSNRDDLEKAKQILSKDITIMPALIDDEIKEIDESSPQMLSFTSISETVPVFEGKVNTAFRHCPSDVGTVGFQKLTPQSQQQQQQVVLNVSSLPGIATVQC